MAGKLVARIINGKVERNGHLFSTVGDDRRKRADKLRQTIWPEFMDK